MIATNPTLADAAVAAGVLLGGFAVAAVLRLSVQNLTRSMKFQGYVTSVVSRVLSTIVVMIAAIYALDLLGIAIAPLLGALGIGSVVLALSLQPVLGNLVGSVMLHARRPIRRGDQIHSNGQAGTVVDINGRAVVMVTFDGETVHIPNLKVLEEPLVNQTAHEDRRTSIPFQVGYEADLRHTREVLERAIRELPELRESPPADVLVEGFGESGIDLVARFWHPSEELLARWAVSEVAITIRETLRAEGITIPFPQRVLHLAPAGEEITP